MAKATLRKIMKRGHEIARKLEGDYRARLSYGLKVAWAEYKEENEVQELKGSPKQIKWAEDIRNDIITNLKRMKEAGFGVDNSIKKICSITDSRVFIENRDSYSNIIPIRIKGHNNTDNNIKGGIVSFFYHDARKMLSVEVGTHFGNSKLIPLQNIDELKEV